MKKCVSFVTLIIWIGCFQAATAYSQTEASSVDPEREIIVMFKSDAITPPSGRTRGRPDEFDIPSQALRQILRNANVQAISRLMPDFRPEDRFAVSRTGETVQLTDWTHVYVLLLPSAPAREGLRTALENRPGVLYAEINDIAELASSYSQ